MSRTLITGVAVVVALGVAALFFIFGNPFTSTTNLSLSMTDTTQPTASSQLVVQDTVVGTGAVAQTGDLITVNYTGKLQNGTVFDTSVGKPAAPGCSQGFCFTLGAGQVIPGWEQGFAGMKVGGKRILIIPPALAYGPNDYGPIPGNSTLVFEVELLGVKPSPEGPAAQ